MTSDNSDLFTATTLYEHTTFFQTASFALSIFDQSYTNDSHRHQAYSEIPNKDKPTYSGSRTYEVRARTTTTRYVVFEQDTAHIALV